MALICLDAGHVGGEVFDLRDFQIDGIRFKEGDFCFEWAVILKRLLEGRGHSVVMTRSRGKRCANLKFDESVKQEARKLVREYSEAEVLRRFMIPRLFLRERSLTSLLEVALENGRDIRERANFSTSLKCDLLLSLHLNGCPRQPTTEKNGILGYLNKSGLEVASSFGKIVLGVADACELPLLEHEQPGQRIGGGLYVRSDLGLLRHSSVPTLILEGPFQNNRPELQRLAQSLDARTQTGSIEGRLEQLSRGVDDSIWIERRKPQ